VVRSDDTAAHGALQLDLGWLFQNTNKAEAALRGVVSFDSALGWTFGVTLGWAPIL
jgi:hypothetical protein